MDGAAVVPGEGSPIIARATDIPEQATHGPLVNCETPEQYELVLESWARGWNAAAAFYQPRLAQSEADADRLYALHYSTPTDRERWVLNAAEQVEAHLDPILRGAK